MKIKKLLSVALSFALVIGSLAGVSGQSTVTKADETKEQLIVYVAAEGKNPSGATVAIDKTPVIVDEGATASDAIKAVLSQSQYKDNHTISTSQYGDSLDEINGITSFQISEDDPYNWAYWSFWVNGNYSDVGMSSYTLQAQDQISLIFTYENSNNECACFADDETLNPDQTEQATLLENAKEQQSVLARKIYEAQFENGKRIPGIEDANGLYTVFSLAQAGFVADTFYDAVYSKVSQQLQGIEKYGKIYDETLQKEITKESIATDASLGKDVLVQYYAKIALCVAALGKNPADVGGVNLYEKLLSKDNYNASSIYSRESMILFAIDAKEAELPIGDNYVTKAELINTLLADVENQLAISVSWNSYDSASMAIQALAPYTKVSVDGVDKDAVKAACDKVLTFLSTMQNAKGGYNGYDSDNNAWSLAQVMTTMGLFEISGLQETEDKVGFIRNGMTVFDAASAFVDVEKNTVDTALMGFQPEQLLRGLNSCIRTEEKAAGVYNTQTVAYTAKEESKCLLSQDMIAAIPNQVYQGKACTPKVIVTYEGTALTEGVDYTVSYANNNVVGTAYAIVTGKGSYALSQRVAFTIVKQTTIQNTDNKNNTTNTTKKVKLKKPVIKKVSSPKKKTLKVTFKKVSGAKKYVVQISMNKKFKKNVKKKTVKKTTATFKKLKSKKRYYVRVRAYNKKVKSAYSKVRSKKVK